MNALWQIERVIGLGMGAGYQLAVLICGQNDKLVLATLRQVHGLYRRCLKDLAGGAVPV